VVTVVQRTSEIGILRAMGASRGQVLRVFLIQGAVIGLVGSIAGSAVGAGFVVMWRLFARNADGSEFFAISLPASLFLATGLIATLTGVLTAILPAIGAARLNPVDAIRG
jgi:lipoprotein-releasing system permease protein